jgi:hypothetical protein
MAGENLMLRSSRPLQVLKYSQLGMLMFIVSNLLGSSIQITTLPLPILSPLQAVRKNSYQSMQIPS